MLLKYRKTKTLSIEYRIFCFSSKCVGPFWAKSMQSPFDNPGIVPYNESGHSVSARTFHRMGGMLISTYWYKSRKTALLSNASFIAWIPEGHFHRGCISRKQEGAYEHG